MTGGDTPKKWIMWNRYMTMPLEGCYPVVLVDGSFDYSYPARFYHDGVVAYFPIKIPDYTRDNVA